MRPPPTGLRALSAPSARRAWVAVALGVLALAGKPVSAQTAVEASGTLGGAWTDSTIWICPSAPPL